MIKRLNIYISHSKKMNYEMELYKPLLNSKIGIENNLLPMTFKSAKDIRDKYVLPRLCWDLGIIDEIIA